ncbi:1-phosphatidylinositol 4,5-bisphosphate phosphodiesterase delta-4 [Tyrophagus putrescentiae]|nr:1-phosphatidylinositol 4,5-bisphosphate phosphodiesterase delta-4 [Tyrophagus putrescentiae]
MPSLKIKQQQQQTKPKTTMSSLFRGRFTRGRSSLRGSTRAGSANSSANRKKIARTRRKVQLKGGHRVTESLRIKPNRLFFDHTAGHIVDRRKWLKSVYSFGPKVKVIGQIEDIEDVKLGMQTANFIEIRKQLEDSNSKNSQKRFKKFRIDEQHCLSIVFRGQLRTVDLIAPTRAARRKWYHALRLLMAASTEYQAIKQDFNVFLLEQFQQADRDRNGIITFDETLAMLRRLNIAFDENETLALFNEANFRQSSNSKADGLDTEEFIRFYELISNTRSLTDDFALLTGGREVLTVEQFRRFLVDVQKFDPNTVHQLSEQLLSAYEPLEANRRANQQQLLSCKGFRNLVLSSHFDIVEPRTRTVHQDMGRPLVDYFIATSHNTYLSEDQLEGRSTTETYRLYLSEGCRSVELDMADGGAEDDHEPVVFHKRTLTSKMRLREIVDTIARYAFKTSPYPVIISLENNCRELSSQRKAAAIFRAGFGRALVTGPICGSSEAVMPSPEELKRRIIIKGKRLPPAASLEDLDELERQHGLASELSDLVWYAASKRFTGDFEEPLGGQWAYHLMTSIEEARSSKYSAKRLSEYRRLTARHLVKVYPHGLRFFSGNYDPLPHWRAGAQMISLNYQTTDTSPMALNEALFEGNGRCGYVLKPWYMTDEEAMVGLVREPVKEHCRFIIRVLCAFNLPVVGRRSIIDPFVQIRLFGTKSFQRGFRRRKRKKRKRTPVVKNNGLNPQWNKEFVFDVESTDLPLVFVRFRVYHRMKFGRRHRLVGQRMIAFDAIAEGYRNVVLRDGRNRPLDHAKLVLAIEKDWAYYREMYGPTKL